MKKELDVCLVELPFSSTAAPVFSLSLLKGCLNRAGIASEVIYGNMLFSCRTGTDDYVRALYNIPQMLLFGEAVFAACAHARPELTADYREKLSVVGCENPKFVPGCVALFDRLEPLAAPFIAELGDLILARNPKIVAMSSLFFQNNACIALANYIKEKAPGIIIMIGGANSVAETAWGLVKNVQSIDYAFSGEADEIFAEVCGRLLREGDIPGAELPYGVITAEMELDGKPVPVRQTADLNGIPYPDYDDYFAQLREYGCEADVVPVVFMEFSRGCWWNMKKPCKFCGLNAGSHRYRIKTTERVLEEIKYLSGRYGIDKFTITDNILSLVHLKELLPALAGKGYRFFAEVKSNLTRAEVQLLKKAGFVLLQPGIESLQDDLLKLMNKGNRAIKHVELLKNFANEGIDPVWHTLIGFPEEKDEYYEEYARLIPLVTHLPSPKQFVHIMYIRSSEYVTNAERYGLSLEPVSFYYCVYPSADFVRLAAVMYQKKDEAVSLRGYDGWMLHPSRKHCADVYDYWHDSSLVLQDRLTASDDGQVMSVTDLRRAAVNLLYSLGGAERAVALAADEVITREALLKRLSGEYSLTDTEAAVDSLKKNRLLLEINGELLFLPLKENHAAVDKDINHKPYGSYRKMALICQY